MSASSGDVPFFIVPFGGVRYERRNVLSISAVVLSPFALS